MSPPPYIPPAPPGWHYQPTLGRWLWWDGIRWIDPGPPPEPTTQRWWPELPPIRFGAAVTSVVFLIAFFAIQQVVAAGDPDSVAVGIAAFGVLGLMVFGMPAVALLASRQFGSSGMLKSIGVRIRWIDLPLAIPGLIAMFVTIVATNLLFAAFQAPIGSNLEGYGDGGMPQSEYVFLIFISVIAAPIVEELLFRGALFRGLLDKMGLWPALILQGLIFGSMHYTPGQGWGNVNLIMSLGALGVLLGLMAKLTGRLGLPMVAHALFNFTSITLMYLSI